MSSILPWIVLLAPLCSAACITLFALRWKALSSFISIMAVLLSFICSCLVFARADISAPQFGWIDVAGALKVPFGLTQDQLSKMMLVLVSGVGAVIHIYSLGYMRDDEGKSRYFGALSLFMFAMLGIVVANNFVMLFMFWELVGFTSYVLIGHWFYRDAAAAAAKKAFITTRIGDFGFMIGILMLWMATGSIVFAEITPRMSMLTSHPTFLTVVALLIFCGAVGKSAQFPLHVWLPDAMEGPTPISALIHAATMVAAGVYMLVRVAFVIQTSQTALLVIAWIGTITAVLAALIATQQNDIKRILAYSTLSQLGYMVMAVGLASNDASMFHLFTHAFFKALLFLAAGSVIVMLHHEQNIWKMGGLSQKLPITFVTFVAGALALIGCPPFSGFFSKDAILALAYQRNVPIFAVGLFTAFLTAFYVIRLLVIVFFGKPRSEVARESRESPAVMTGPLIVLALLATLGGFAFFARRFLALPIEKEVAVFVPAVAIVALILGSGLAIVLYRNRASEPLDLQLLRHKFYFDEFYRWLIYWTQELLAGVFAFFDRWIIDAGAVSGSGRGTLGIGALLRLIQIGNLQAYLFLFGLGIVALIYFAVFH
ncbi:MAG: NADH-quinone oxidoreductase subunit L [Verrucomicrobia bacterium]|nr:MAG: NADH-quinone oxidoreductase subunit L [Verrucomicrobiota bacterium]PYJ93832.1 MAG: NADH-quinone oxidoreductase subunit L [Verrucomicrobiota bacterium]PYL21575.1 MAG: NADH-quinone oxidoreductase subunit L [Verrucomicrobiota bacterium]PYL81882.1 MAG: NADH-quinone oxidoreductase subunit L [Verrucomicrobiota bacterium]